ncbi:glycosyltransferase family 39 protein [bacterium]|nr:glycosyltransferase family 39 protein [bacterium]
MPAPVEKRVQDFVVGIDNFSPKAIRMIVWLAVAVILMFSSFASFTSQPIRLSSIDAIDYAQVARNISIGEGYTTNFIRPISLRYYPSFEKHPELTNPPLYSYYLSLILKMFVRPNTTPDEIDRKLILFGSGLFFVFSVPLMFWLASRILRKKAVTLAMLFFCTNIILLKRSITALPDMFLLFLFLSFLIALSYYKGENLFLPAVIGLFLGLCYLTRYSYGLFAVVTIIFIFKKAKKFKIFHVLMFVVTFLAVISPWLMRNYHLMGNPFFSLEFFKYKMFVEAFSGNLYWRSTVDAIFNGELPFFFLVRKFGLGLKSNYIGLLTTTGNFLASFFIVALFTKGFAERLKGFKWAVIAMYIIVFLTSSLFRPGADVFLAFMPLVIIIAVDLFDSIVEAKSIDPFKKVGLVALFIIINCSPTVWGYARKVFNENMYKPPKKYMEENIFEVAKLIPKDAVIISDIPWATAWYGNIKSIWLPWGEDDYQYIVDTAGRIDGAYFSPLVLRYPQTSKKIWTKFYTYVSAYRRAPEGNIFGWDWAQRFKLGDAFCFKKDRLLK